MLWYIVIAILIYVAYSKMCKASRYWKDRKIPYKPAKPKLIDIMNLIQRKHNLVEQTNILYNEFPNDRYHGIFVILQPALLIRDPELIKQVTVKDFDHFMDRTSIVNEEIDPFLSRNLTGLTGQKWREMRSILSPSFTGSKMKFMFSLVANCAQEFCKFFEEQDDSFLIEVDMKDVFSRFSNDVIATTAFGIEIDSLRNRDNKFLEMGKDVTNVAGSRVLRFWGYVLFPALMKFLKIPIFPNTFSNFFGSVIHDTIEYRKAHNTVRPDMIHLLMEAKNDISEDDIAAQALLFFFAGFENVSLLLSFMTYELAVNQDVQSKLYNEIVETLESFNGHITYEAVHDMKYLDAVLSETLRKWPPAIMLDRVCVKDYTIPAELPGEVALTVDKGTQVLIPIVSLHYDPKYFPEPEKFLPERFSDENKDRIVPFTYNPFGCGPRNCIASRFALMEAKILAFYFLAKFKVVPTNKTPIPLILSRKKWIMVPDEGFWLRLEKRDDQN